MKYAEVMRFAMGTTWAIEREKLQVIAGILALRAQGKKLSKAEVQARIEPFAARGPSDMARAGSVAIVPIRGFLSKRAGMFGDVSGGTSTDELTKTFRTLAADETIGAVLLDIDSGGGTVPGTPECFQSILALGAAKKCLALVNASAGSAAYWLASAGSEVWITPSGKCGSIGVFTVHEDLSKAMEMEGVSTTVIQAGKFKTEGSPLGPLSDEARAALQADVNETYDAFVRDVAQGRGVTPKVVKADFGEGRMLSAKAAKAAGMVDKVGTMDEAITYLMGAKRKAPMMSGMGAEVLPAPTFAADPPPVVERQEVTVEEAPEPTLEVIASDVRTAFDEELELKRKDHTAELELRRAKLRLADFS